MATKLQTQIDQARMKVAEQEAILGDLKEKLARLLKQQNPADAAAVSGLDLLWKAALPKSRERSSRHKCRVAWHRIPKSERPSLDLAISALKAWNRCEEWSKDRSQFAPGLHRFISERMWEDVPEVHDPLGVYRKPAKPAAPDPDPDDLASADDVAEILGGLTRRVRTTDDDQP